MKLKQPFASHLPEDILLMLGERLKLAVLGISLVLGACASGGTTNGMVKMDGQSAVDLKTQMGAAELVWYSMQRNGCVRTEKITASIIDKSPDFQAAPGFVAAGRVRERWIASGCGKQVPYFVDFIAGKQTEGGATIYIQIDKTQLSQPQN